MTADLRKQNEKPRSYCTSRISQGKQDDVRDKFFAHAERVDAYAAGKLAFEQGSQRNYNPYTVSKDLAGLWWYGWDRAQKRAQDKERHWINVG